MGVPCNYQKKKKSYEDGEMIKQAFYEAVV
ncbi:unnamed protein product [Acanthoscelides obtectus]|uniref:Uncharacterized protein n=1 Tax=Acanthoscelides obtectus TaxID=200917 RepID=A0A9P0P695_ACAOB|nr:unnamed protein product [Acanthoscelides obtectus]CAK1673411.1 hypothetical protein AOBTE_LOCUS29327 [Acanthoscelides obtectus]